MIAIAIKNFIEWQVYEMAHSPQLQFSPAHFSVRRRGDESPLRAAIWEIKRFQLFF